MRRRQWLAGDGLIRYNKSGHIYNMCTRGSGKLARRLNGICLEGEKKKNYTRYILCTRWSEKAIYVSTYTYVCCDDSRGLRRRRRRRCLCRFKSISHPVHEFVCIYIAYTCICANCKKEERTGYCCSVRAHTRI